MKGGAEVYINQLQNLLPVYGHKSYWLGIEERAGAFSIAEFNKGRLVNIRGLKNVFHFIMEYINKNEIDIINIHNIFNPSIIKFCLSVLPVVKSVHSPVMVCPGKDKFWRYSEKPCNIKYGLHCFKHIYTEGCANRSPKRVIKAWNYVNFETGEAAGRYQRIVVMSDYIRKGMLECGIPESQIVCNPYFTPEINDPDIAVFSSEIKRILFIGRLISSKGPHIMLKSLARLLNKRNDLILDVIGDGKMKESLKSMANNLGLNHKVVFHGWMDKAGVDLALRKSYLILFPSIYPEAFGIVGIESMMHGKPIVGFDVGGVGTWLKDGVNGYLIPVGDGDKMSERTEMLLSDPSIYEKMCINARRMALERYIPEVHINKLIGIYAKYAIAKD